jgi:hypothetical protein
MEFIRLLDNTTGSFLTGSKENTYGPKQTFKVDVDDILEVLSLEKFDFVKMDVEGHEVVLLQRIPDDLLNQTQIMLEVGSERNAASVFELIQSRKIPAYSQKLNWAQVKTFQDLPNHHSQGSLFLSFTGPPRWN